MRYLEKMIATITGGIIAKRAWADMNPIRTDSLPMPSEIVTVIVLAYVLVRIRGKSRSPQDNINV